MPRKSVLSEKSKIEEAVRFCSSVKECLEYLGLRAAGGNYKQFHAWCKRHNIIPPKGDNLSGFRNHSIRKTIPLDSLLTKDSKYSRYHLKKRLIKEGLLENKCYECGCLPEWNDKPLSLQLDHINGVANDNRLENLRLLCPNCHSQTATFAGKRYSQAEYHKLFCFHCKKPITKFATTGLCKKCCAIRSNFKKRKVKRPSKDELEKMIWEIPTSQLAHQLGVSDVAISKWCKSYGISKPPRGYWAKENQLKT
jgi:hypothetical protein